MMGPGLAVPHPSNRGGDPVVSLRTKQLAGFVAQVGFDATEVKSCAVAVQDPATRGGGDTYQELFERQTANDPDMAKQIGGIDACIGTLSHSHLNCVLRNIQAGMRGCACGRPEGGACACERGLKAFLSEDGNYDLSALRRKDEAWAALIDTGVPWEVLASAMNIEEPDAALTISIALNKKNEAAMETAHTEIMRTLVGLCKPSPDYDRSSAVAEFETIRNKMLDLYGATVDHPDFIKAFQLVVEAGGADSPHMSDLQDFTGVFVNPKMRKLRWETYGLVAPLPPEFPRVKNALLKWTWKQTPVRGWCPLPPNLHYRLDANAKLSMSEVCKHLERAMVVTSQIASAVAENTHDKVKFIAEVDIGLIQLLMSVPKTDPSNTVEQQRDGLMLKCAEFLAVKTDAFLKEQRRDVAKDFWKKSEALNPVLKKALELISTPDALIQLQGAESAVAEKKSGRAPAQAPPSAAGTPSSGTKRQMPATTVTPEVVPWKPWMAAMPPLVLLPCIKAVARTAINQVTEQFRSALGELPMAIVREKNGIACRATADIPKRTFVVPLFVRKDTSMLLDDGVQAFSRLAVKVQVSWVTPAVAGSAESEALAEETHRLSVQPELRLPARPETPGGDVKWELADNVHPFWVLPRTRTAEDRPNCSLMNHLTTVVVATQAPKGSAKVPAGAQTYRVELPYIINEEKIAKGGDLMLDCELLAVEKKRKDRVVGSRRDHI